MEFRVYEPCPGNAGFFLKYATTDASRRLSLHTINHRCTHLIISGHRRVTKAGVLSPRPHDVERRDINDDGERAY
jgi:hypothetical protein